MTPAQLNVLCAAFQNVDRMGLATGDPGPSGASNDSGIAKATISWSAPADGVMTATANWVSVMGSFTHVTLWDGSVFVHAVPKAITLGSATDLAVAVEHKVTG